MNNDTPTNITQLPQPGEQQVPATSPPARLTPKTIANLATALGRYAQITQTLSSGILTPETATLQAEQTGLRQFLGSAFLTHGPELIACHAIVHSEYEPILQGIAIVARRIGLLGAPAVEEQTPTTTEPAK